MANWEKLNKEFDECLANLTDEEFQKWYDERLTNRKKRRFKMKERFNKDDFTVTEISDATKEIQKNYTSNY